MKTNPHDAAMDDLYIRREHRFSGASRIILLSTLLFAVLGIWAYFGKLDEVSTGSGKVIPSSREQVLQSLDGGILAELTVREGDKVQANQIVARLDPTRSESNVGRAPPVIAPHWPPAQGSMPKLTICRWSFPIHCAPGRISSPPKLACIKAAARSLRIQWRNCRMRWSR